MLMQKRFQSDPNTGRWKMFQKLLVIIDIHNWLSGLHIILEVCLMLHHWEFHLQFATNFYKSVVHNHTLLILTRSFQKDYSAKQSEQNLT